MLSLAQKREIINSFEELREHEDKFGRFFYYFDKSPTRKKIVAREFVSSGNGYVYGLLLPEYKDVLYQDGSVCVKEFSAEELKYIIRKSIESLRGSGRA
jgi:hypothetical protein